MLKEYHLESLRNMFHLLGDNSRLQIVLACLQQPQRVNDLVERLGASQPLVSHHLRLLKDARLLKADRRGRAVFYSLTDEHVRCVLTDMLAHVQHN
jgi:DNA-binding transcriptional ArsR family regulator